MGHTGSHKMKKSTGGCDARHWNGTSPPTATDIMRMLLLKYFQAQVRSINHPPRRERERERVGVRGLAGWVRNIIIHSCCRTCVSRVRLIKVPDCRLWSCSLQHPLTHTRARTPANRLPFFHVRMAILTARENTTTLSPSRPPIVFFSPGRVDWRAQTNFGICCSCCCCGA